MKTIFQELGYGFDTVYTAADEFALFTSFIKLKMVRKISQSRINRLFGLYTTIRKWGRFEERECSFEYSELYENVSRNTLLLDLHLLEDAGLLNKTYDWPNGVSVKARDVVSYANPNPVRM